VSRRRPGEGFIDDGELSALAQPLRKSGYGDYLLDLLAPDADPPVGVELSA